MNNKKQFLNTTTDRRSYHIIRCVNQEPYWDECLHNSWHKAKGRKRRNKRKKELLNYEYRRYRTWKYHRIKQWKI